MVHVCQHRSMLVRSRASVRFRERTCKATVDTVVATLSDGTFLRTDRLLEELTKSTGCQDFQCVKRMVVLSCKNDSGGFWCVIDCRAQRVQVVLGFFLTVKERLQEVSICGRQRLRPQCRRLHMLLESFGFSQHRMSAIRQLVA